MGIGVLFGKCSEIYCARREERPYEENRGLAESDVVYQSRD